jgi:hypothetical protein
MSARCEIRPGQQGFEKPRGMTPAAGEKRRSWGYGFDALVAHGGRFYSRIHDKGCDQKGTAGKGNAVIQDTKNPLAKNSFPMRKSPLMLCGALAPMGCQRG